ncbi:hypothetical protein MBLNU459_g6078t1 [Dothideomycetes sp. NU459]
MPDPSPSPSGSIFGRKPSLFASKKQRKNSATPISPPVPEEPSPRDHRAPSVASLASSVAEETLQRSTSIRSHESQSSGQLHKGRAPSVTTFTSHSPVRSQHRPTRSVSGNNTAQSKLHLGASTISPQKSTESFSQGSPSSRGRQQPFGPPDASLPRTPHAMLGAPFGHGLNRKDSERPSLVSQNTNTSVAPSHAPTQSGGLLTPAAVLTHIHELSHKRIATLEYLRKLHEGNVFYFNTLSYSTSNLAHMPALHPARLGRRATNYVLLGTSIPPALDLAANNPLEYLRTLAALLAEYETYQSLNNPDTSAGLSRGRMGAMFKSGMRGVKGRRSSAAAESLMSIDNDSSATLDSMPLPPTSSHHHHHHHHHNHEFTYLQTPTLPFDPEFNTSFATLTDILIDTYGGVLQLLPSPEAVAPGVGEAFGKADKILRKILVQSIVQEFGDVTRKEIKSEVGGLGKVVLSGLM